jgi:surfeit locus 1 family protein
MPTRRPLLIFIALALLFAGVCARLGVWQLHRLVERRAWNAHLEQRLADAPVPVPTLPADSSLGHYRRVSARGTYDFDRQVALAGRSSMGSPGVHVLTPLRLPSGHTVMINRGWVYSPNAMTIDSRRWREHEGDTVTITGYADTWSGRETAATLPGLRLVRTLDSAAVAQRVGAPIAPYYIVQTSDSTPNPSRPVRLGEPVLDDGSHRGYAIQWFSFALVALIGSGLLVREELLRRRASV